MIDENWIIVELVINIFGATDSIRTEPDNYSHFIQILCLVYTCGLQSRYVARVDKWRPNYT
jgi:hypothetical protein